MTNHYHKPDDYLLFSSFFPCQIKSTWSHRVPASPRDFSSQGKCQNLPTSPALWFQRWGMCQFCLKRRLPGCHDLEFFFIWHVKWWFNCWNPCNRGATTVWISGSTIRAIHSVHTETIYCTWTRIITYPVHCKKAQIITLGRDAWSQYCPQKPNCSNHGSGIVILPSLVYFQDTEFPVSGLKGREKIFIWPEKNCVFPVTPWCVTRAIVPLW
jgi:hypothetical protein